MNNLIIEKTKGTLGVNFNSRSGKCELTGSSYPENSIKFFKPLIDWLKEYGEQGKAGISLDLRIMYINSSSTECILDIFELLEGLQKKKGNIKVNWYYPQKEEDLRETGVELTEQFKIPVDFIPYKGE